jgi:hypothetical protein
MEYKKSSVFPVSMIAFRKRGVVDPSSAEG